MGPRDSPPAPGASPGFPLSSRPVFRWDTRALHLETPRLFLQNLRLAWTCSPQRQRCVVSKTRHPGRKIEVLGNRDLVESSKNGIKQIGFNRNKTFYKGFVSKTKFFGGRNRRGPLWGPRGASRPHAVVLQLIPRFFALLRARNVTCSALTSLLGPLLRVLLGKCFRLCAGRHGAYGRFFSA